MALSLKCRVCKVRSSEFKSLVRFVTSDLVDHSTARCPFPANKRPEPSCSGSEKRIPPGPRSLPLIGTLYKYLPFFGSYSMRNQQRTDTLRYETYGPVVREEVIPGQIMYYIYDPDLFPEVFSQEPKYPNRFAMEGVNAYRKSRNQHPGFPNSEGQDWYEIRKPVNQIMMKTSSVASYTGHQNAVARDMVSLVRTRRNDIQEVSDLQSILYRFGMECIGVVIFDSRLGTLSAEPGSETEKFVSATNDAFDTMYDTTFFWPLHKNQKTKTWRRLEQSFDYISSMTEKYMDQCLAKTDPGDENVLHSLMTKYNLSRSQVMSVLTDLFYAGVDTVAYVIAFTMYLLAKYPETQEMLYAEITQECPKGDEITFLKLKRMKYLKAVIKESLRLKPVSAFGVARRFDNDITVAGFHIPAGSFVFLQPNVLALSQKIFPEADIFRPERWLRGKNESYVSYPMIPFGYGGRMCAGKRFAEQEIQLGLINLLHSFRVEYHYDDMGMVTKFLNQPDKPLNFTLHDR